MDPQVFRSYVRRILAYDCMMRNFFEHCKIYAREQYLLWDCLRCTITEGSIKLKISKNNFPHIIWTIRNGNLRRYTCIGINRNSDKNKLIHWPTRKIKQYGGNADDILTVPSIPRLNEVSLPPPIPLIVKRETFPSSIYHVSRGVIAVRKCHVCCALLFSVRRKS